MTYEEAEDICLDVLTEYLPKTISKAVKREVITELLRELSEQGALDVELPEVGDESDEDLVSLLRDRE